MWRGDSRSCRGPEIKGGGGTRVQWMLSLLDLSLKGGTGYVTSYQGGDWAYGNSLWTLSGTENNSGEWGFVSQCL